MLVSVVIVTWNNDDEIEECILSVRNETNGLEYEIIVVDNASSDSTKEVLKSLEQDRLVLIFNDENTGYTIGVNKGIKSASGKYIMLLNPDTKLLNNAISILADFLEQNNEYGACAPLLLNEDGSMQKSVRNFPDHKIMFYEFSMLSNAFPNSRKFGKWKMKYEKYDSDIDVNQPMAAALMVRSEINNKKTLLNETYEMFFNDVELCKDIYDNGLKIRLLTAAKIMHRKGTSIHKNRARMIRIWNKDCMKYFEKHHNKKFTNQILNIALKLSGMIRTSFS